ncbi:MAG: prevent-host-death protein [Ignavibacteriales bacterium CG07_land_8_20_14_0_80_59_12]|nr:MAG: prevent-host-death protein [Ignavibacteriales bacterium CG07_land_8_20_14_0_80_59_12]
MKFSASVKPISYLKTHASRLIRDLSDNQGTLIVTRNGQAKAVVQDIRTFERTQEALALLKMLTRSQRNIRRGKAKSLDAVLTSLQRRIQALKNEKI